MALVRTLLPREDSEVAALIRSWVPEDEPQALPEPVYEAPKGVPLVAAQMFGGVGHTVTTRVVTR